VCVTTRGTDRSFACPTICRSAAGGRLRPTVSFNGLFGGTSPPELPNLGIAMKMDDAK
jgi:hypothetical protein